MKIVVTNPGAPAVTFSNQESIREGAAPIDDYERLLEEKSEVIRELHNKMQELSERLGELEASGPTTLGQAEEIIALSEELNRERQQLAEDEEVLTKRMRDMEI